MLLFFQSGGIEKEYSQSLLIAICDWLPVKAKQVGLAAEPWQAPVADGY